MKWYLGAALLLLAALVLDSGLLAYSTYVLLGLLILTRLLARSWMEGLSATRKCSAAVAEIGDRVAVEVTVRNDGRLTVPWVLMEDQLPRHAITPPAFRLKVKGKRIALRLIRAGGEVVLRYHLTCLLRGYYQVGPVLLENGDLFGLHRRYRVAAEPAYVLVYPKVVPLIGYELASRRPIGDVILTHRLYEDPTRIGGVRPYEAGDPINRVHWRATARTGTLHSKVYEPSTIAGATILLDFHQAGYPARGEPARSELAATTAASLANAVALMGQQVGLVTNARDAAERIRLEGWDKDLPTRQAGREAAAMGEGAERLKPLVVETRRGPEQLQRIRETLARAELCDAMPFAALVLEAAGRLPRDATVVAVLPDVPVETAIALGSLRRHGFAVTAVLVAFEGRQFERAYGRLLAEGIRDVRHLRDEAGLPTLCRRQIAGASAIYFDEPEGEEETAEAPGWAQQTPLGMTDAEED